MSERAYPSLERQCPVEQTVEDFFETKEGKRRMHSLRESIVETRDLVLWATEDIESPEDESQLHYFLENPTLLNWRRDEAFMKQHFLPNRAVHTIIDTQKRLSHLGDLGANKMYAPLSMALGMVIRHDLYRGDYDPDSAFWEDCARRIPQYKSDEVLQYVPSLRKRETHL